MSWHCIGEVVATARSSTVSPHPVLASVACQAARLPEQYEVTVRPRSQAGRGTPCARSDSEART